MHLNVQGASVSGQTHLCEFGLTELPRHWSWDGRRLRASSDPYGMRPLFYAAWADRIVLSTSICGALQSGAPRDIDEAALSVFFRLGTFLGNDTPFRSVRLMPPRGSLTWEDGKLQISGDFARLAKPLSLTRKDAIDGYIDLFRQAIARRPAENFALALSGGRDSRHIALELSRQHRLPEFIVTSCWPHPEEARIAGLIASRLGRPHRVVSAGDLPGCEWKKNARTNFAALEHGWFVPVADALSGRVSYDGIGGDVLSAGLFLEEWNLGLFEKRRFEELARRLVTPGRIPTWNIDLPYDAAMDRVIQELRFHSNAANPVGSFYFWSRTRRMIGSSAFNLIPGTVYAPYLDPDLWEFLSGLPARMFLDHTFHTETIARAYPEFADVPYAASKSMRFPYSRYALRALASLRRPARYVSTGPMSLRLLRTLMSPRFRTEADWLGCHLTYIQQLSACSTCAAGKINESARAKRDGFSPRCKIEAQFQPLTVR